MSIEAEAMNEISKKWGWFLAIGIILVILGTVGIGATFALTLTTVTFFGFLIVIAGVFQLIDAFSQKGWSLVGNILIALLYGAVGYTMITNPMLASATLTLFIAWALIAIGIIRIIVAFKIKGAPGWIWTLIAAIAAIVLGIMILNNWPESGLWVIGMFVAIELIFNGWGLIMLGVAAKKMRS
ncbi:MAG: HdeD family acid-resistance protein [Arenicellales bacterium]